MNKLQINKEQNSCAIQTEQIECEKCAITNLKVSELVEDCVREKTARLKVESNFDIKKKRYEKVIKDFKWLWTLDRRCTIKLLNFCIVKILYCIVETYRKPVPI